jgi:hypothetical protein
MALGLTKSLVEMIKVKVKINLHVQQSTQGLEEE